MPSPAATTERPGSATGHTPRILIVGGGYVGMYTALRLRRRLREGEARITVVDPRSYMTYQPFLPETAAGSIQPRHTVVPLRRTLRGVEVVSAEVVSVDHERRAATFQPHQGDAYERGYDVLVMAPGSVSRVMPTPGLAEHAIGFKSVQEAIALRNKVLESMDVADSTHDAELRRRVLTFVVVGAGYAGVEVVAELEDMARYAARYYANVSPADMRWVLVEASNRILPEVGEDLGRYTLDRLRERGIDVRLQTTLDSCVDGDVVLSDGSTFGAETVVWTAGVQAHPMLAATGLPLDDRGRLVCDADLRVHGVDGAWGAGDCAAVPDVTNPGQLCSASAQHAVRQAEQLGDNIAAVLRGRAPQEYRHAYAGSVASLGLYKGVAQVYGVKLRGFPAWFMHRTYHMSRVPTFQRKVAVVADWTLAFFFQRDITSLWSTDDHGATLLRRREAA